jgi:hypothetical protein
MIINSSQIRMDASAGHKDVSRTADGRLLSRNHAGRNEEQFSLDLPSMAEMQARRESTLFGGIQQARSLIESADNSQKSYDDKHVIVKAIDELTGARTAIGAFTPGNRSSSRLQDFLALRGGQKRFYQVGGQQFRMIFSSLRVHYEYEFVDFTSSGAVRTADGRSIDFSFDLSLQRTSVIRESVLGRAASGYLVDPLVLHFDNGLDKLMEQSFLFDLDGDGEKEEIAGLGRGSGFLALDVDGDNAITSGTELFGPRSGSGFSDLAVHDLDGNHWIDENDPVFAKLRIWMNASGSRQELLSLKDAGVGAISLANAGSLFNLKTSANILLGQVAASGIFLTEDGQVKSLQDLHLRVAGENGETSEVAAVSGDIERALMALRAIISAQRRQLIILQGWQIGAMRREDEDLIRKFWQWQERA